MTFPQSKNEKRQFVLALKDCRIRRPAEFSGAVEIVSASPAVREFPLRVTETFGVCLKTGSAHTVFSDGKRMQYPADSVCVRYPGCVWSCETTESAFVSIDIATWLLKTEIPHSPMRFFSPSELPGAAALIFNLANGTEGLQKAETLAELLAILSTRGVLNSDFISEDINSRQAIFRARDFLSANVAQNPTLDELANAASINKYVLVRHFKKELGITPHRYLVQLRIERNRMLFGRRSFRHRRCRQFRFCGPIAYDSPVPACSWTTPARYSKQVRSSVGVRTLPKKLQSILF